MIKLSSLLGACKAYRRFVGKFAGIEIPLNKMLEKHAEVQRTDLSEENLKSFRDLKKNHASPPVLGIQKRGCRYMVDMDARRYVLGEVLW